MGWLKKVFGKTKSKKSSDHSTENERRNDASDHGNKPPEPEEGDNRQPEAPEASEAPEENKDEENTNQVAPTLPDHESPPQHHSETNYHPWLIYGPEGWHPAGYHQQEDYHRGGYPAYGSEASEQQNWGSFSHQPQYIGCHGDQGSGRFTGYDNFAGSSGRVNNYWNPPRMIDYDRWKREQFVPSDQDVWTSDYWKGLFGPPQGGWS